MKAPKGSAHPILHCSAWQARGPEKGRTGAQDSTGDRSGYLPRTQPTQVPAPAYHIVPLSWPGIISKCKARTNTEYHWTGPKILQKGRTARNKTKCGAGHEIFETGFFFDILKTPELHTGLSSQK